METILNEIINNLDYFLSIISVVTCFILSLIINIKKIKKLKQENKDISNTELVNQLLYGLIEDAETFKNYSGVEKKEYVVTKVSKFLINNNIKLDEEKISTMIEELIKLTNNVNIDKTRKYITSLNKE